MRKKCSLKIPYCSRLSAFGLMMAVYSSAILVGNEKVIAVVLLCILSYGFAVVMKGVFH